MNLEERLKQLAEELQSTKERLTKYEQFVDVSPVMRPTIVGMEKVYTADVPLYTWMSSQALPVAATSLGRLYKVIDDLGPVYEQAGATGSITDTERGEGTCANRIDINFCQTDFRAYRVAVEGCVEDTDLDVPFVTGRDAIPGEAGVNTVGDYRDVKVGEQMRKAKNFLLAQGLGNANQEPESLETMINQTTTPNVIDNAGSSVFEFAIMAVLAKIGLTTNANSYISQDGSVVLWVNPLLEWTMYRRASLPGMENFYELRNGRVFFMGIPVFADASIYTDPDTGFTSVFILKAGMVGVIEQFDVDREVRINEQNNPETCEDDCVRLYNYETGLSRGNFTMGRVINVQPMLFNSVISGLTSQLNNPNAGTQGGAV